MSLGIAICLVEFAPPQIKEPLSFLIELLAAIPSVIYGLWGIFVLAPFLRNNVEPFLAKYFGFLPFFQGPRYGIGMLAAGVVTFSLVIMAWYGVNFVLGAGLHSYGFGSGGLTYMATYVGIQVGFTAYAYYFWRRAKGRP